MRIAVSLLLIVLSNQLCAMTMPETINEAGRQRMLSQKIAKAYFMLGFKNDSISAASQIKNSSYQFERNLQALKHSELTKDLIPQLVSIEAQWLNYKKIINQPVSIESAAVVLQASEQLLEKTHTYAIDLQKIAGTKTAILINISGHQRMLSQRLAKNFLADSLGVDNQNAKEKYKSDLLEFKKNLQFLLKNPSNTKEINTKLQKVQTRLTFISKVLDGAVKLSGSRSMLIVTGTTNNILQNMDDITRLYVALATD